MPASEFSSGNQAPDPRQAALPLIPGQKQAPIFDQSIADLSLEQVTGIIYPHWTFRRLFDLENIPRLQPSREFLCEFMGRAERLGADARPKLIAELHRRLFADAEGQMPPQAQAELA